MPLRVALVNDYPVVVSGVAAMLAPFEEVTVVELDARLTPAQSVDIALYDSFAVTHAGEVELRELVVKPLVAAVVVYTWNLHPELLAHARDAQVRGYLSKACGGAELVNAFVRIAAGEEVYLNPGGTRESEADHGDWPGKSEGLTQRQAEVIALVAQGLTNNEIAARLYISHNTLKSYIREGYRRVGVTTRTQAALWGLEHGFGLPVPWRQRR